MPDSSFKQPTASSVKTAWEEIYTEDGRECLPAAIEWMEAVVVLPPMVRAHEQTAVGFLRSLAAEDKQSALATPEVIARIVMPYFLAGYRLGKLTAEADLLEELANGEDKR